MVPLLGDLSALAAAAALVVVSLGPLRPLVRSFLEPLPVLRDAAEQLAVLIPTGARFATPQHLWYRPYSIMAQWLPRTVGSRGSRDGTRCRG